MRDMNPLSLLLGRNNVQESNISNQRDPGSNDRNNIMMSNKQNIQSSSGNHINQRNKKETLFR
jgi:hypothetical protein